MRRRLFTLNRVDTEALRRVVEARKYAPEEAGTLRSSWSPAMTVELARLGRAYGFDPESVQELNLANNGAVLLAAPTRKPEDCAGCGHAIASHRLRARGAPCSVVGCSCKALRT